MNTKRILIFVFLLILVNFVHSMTLHTFNDLANPRMFALDDHYIYISDPHNPSRNKIFIYDLASYKLVKFLLRKGEGPGEVTYPPAVLVNEHKISFFATNKLVFYNKKFQLINEMRLPFTDADMAAVKDKYVVLHYEGDDRALNETCSLYGIQNMKLEKIRDLVALSVDTAESDKYLISNALSFDAWNDRVFITQPQKGFYIEVFDENGSQVFTIEKKVDKIKATEMHRKRELASLMAHFGKKLFKAAIEERFAKKSLPVFLPDIMGMQAGENRLYIHTYDIRGNEDKYIILDFKGNIIAIKWLPQADVSTFYNNQFYYLKESENDEGWGFNVIELKK